MKNSKFVINAVAVLLSSAGPVAGGSRVSLMLFGADGVSGTTNSGSLDCYLLHIDAPDVSKWSE